MLQRYGIISSADELKHDSMAKIIPREQLEEVIRLAFDSADKLAAENRKTTPWELPEQLQLAWLEQNSTLPADDVRSSFESKRWVTFIKRRRDTGSSVNSSCVTACQYCSTNMTAKSVGFACE